jgi:hypothetical protein
MVDMIFREKGMEPERVRSVYKIYLARIGE